MEVLIAKFKKQPQQLPPKEASETRQLPLEYHKCTVCAASFSSISRLLSHNRNAICGKPSCEHCEEKFDSNNKLHEHLGTCSATKPRKTTAKAASTTSSNADIAVKKEGVDRTATTTTAAATKMSLPATQLATQPAFQLATQKGTTQAANETAAFKEALEIAISTPLSKAFECRRCSAEFSFNSQLHRHIRESHSIGTASSTVHSAFKNSAPSSASRAIVPLATPLTSPRAAINHTANRATTRPATPPPTYRAVSPPPPVYQATPKAYLTVQDLYMRYASLKFIHPAKLAPKSTRTASYLTV